MSSYREYAASVSTSSGGTQPSPALKNAGAFLRTVVKEPQLAKGLSVVSADVKQPNLGIGYKIKNTVVGFIVQKCGGSGTTHSPSLALLQLTPAQLDTCVVAVTMHAPFERAVENADERYFRYTGMNAADKSTPVGRELLLIAVNPRFQRQGVARQLLSSLLTRWNVPVFTDAVHQGSVALMETLGFVRLKLRRSTKHVEFVSTPMVYVPRKITQKYRRKHDVYKKIRLSTKFKQQVTHKRNNMSTSRVPVVHGKGKQYWDYFAKQEAKKKRDRKVIDLDYGNDDEFGEEEYDPEETESDDDAESKERKRSASRKRAAAAHYWNGRKGGVPKASIKRISHRAGVYALAKNAYPIVSNRLVDLTEDVFRRALVLVLEAGRTTVLAQDIDYVLRGHSHS